MKQAIAILMTFVLCWNVSQEGVLLLWYEVANASFTERFCVNVEAPELMCHGKCQIDQLQKDKEEKPAQHTPASSPRFNFIALLPGHIPSPEFLFSDRSSAFHFIWTYDFSPDRSLFRPPPAASLFV